MTKAGAVQPEKTVTDPAHPGRRVELHMLMRDSGALLLDWVLHHKALGFEGITVHGDGNPVAEAVGRALASEGLIRFIPGDADDPVGEQQREKQAMDASVVDAAEGQVDYLLWLAPEDYLVLGADLPTLNDLFSALSEPPDLLSVTCQMIGGSGQLRYQDAPPCSRFVYGSGGQEGQPLLALVLRTFFRPGLVRSVRLARPVLKNKYRSGRDPVTWMDGAGADTEGRYLDKGWTAPRDQPGFGLARVLSYAVQDRETWLLRRLAGGPTLPFITADALKGAIQQYARQNFAGVSVDPAGSGCARLLSARSEALATMPAVRAAHEAAVAEFSTRLDRLLPIQHERARQAIGLFLGGRPIPLALLDWPVPFGVETTSPLLSEASSAWAATLTARQQDDEDDSGVWGDAEDDALDEDAAPIAAQAPGLAPSRSTRQLSEAPAWLADLRLSGNAHGFYHSMPNYACTYVARTAEHLVVSFDNLASVRENPVGRQPWGYDFVRKSGLSHFSVMSFVPGWFRDKTLHDYLVALRDSGFFTQFKSVTMFGTSMGGYGATAFSSLAPGCKVAAFSPQSTLAPALVPWDYRYPSGRRSEWDGLFRDAADEGRAASELWLFYDPRVEADRRHIERFSGDNVRRVPLRHADHKTALMLRNGNVLSAAMRMIIHGHATTAGLLNLYRSCRTLPAYVEQLQRRAADSARPGRVERIDRAVEALRNRAANTDTAGGG